jgi:desulfoferrodoxin (superoxide reductase-like protein)
MELGDQQLQQLCIEVLRELDENGVFPSAEIRQNIVVGVCDVGSDNTEEDFLQWVEAVNPPVVMERLRRELQEAKDLSNPAKLMR